MAKPSMPTAGKPAPSESQTLPEKPGTSIDLEQIIKAEASTAGKTRLAVYDLNTSEPFKIIVQILSEALREEIFRMGAFSLVNRENMDQVLNEMGLQQTGLVEEGQAVRAGKGLAAAQIVLGQFGVLGSTSVLQVKRIDVETQGTLAVGSLRCSHGREEELLAGLSDLARKLAGKK
jgi:curli biogenesis system outer membrane secretion channel CsgG